MTRTVVDIPGLLSRLNAEQIKGEYRAACPLCQPEECNPAKYRLRITPGEVRPVLLGCVRCAGAYFSAILETLGLEVGDLGERTTPEKIEEAWAEAGVSQAERQQQYPLGGVPLRDAVYKSILRQCPLQHSGREWLERRGIPPQVAVGWGYGQMPKFRAGKQALGEALLNEFGSDVYKVPGIRYLTPKEGIARAEVVGLDNLHGVIIPCRDRDGNILALKVRSTSRSKGRYNLLSSSGCGGPKGVVVFHHPLSKPRGGGGPSSLWIVEGERKADYCRYVWAKKHSQERFLSIPGVRCLAGLRDEVAALRPTLVILALDKDLAGEKASLDIANLLAGHFPLAYADWPPSEKGLDDRLQRGLLPLAINGEASEFEHWCDMVKDKIHSMEAIR